MVYLGFTADLKTLIDRVKDFGIISQICNS